MYTRASVSTDRYNGDESGSGREDAQNATAVSSDWSVRPSDDAGADGGQTNSLSRLNPAAAPFSFAGGSAAAAVSGVSPGGNDLLSGAVAPPHGGVGSASSGLLRHHHHQQQHASMLSGSSLDSALSPVPIPQGRGVGGGGGAGTNMNSSGTTGGVNSGSGVGLDGPNAYGMMPGMLASPYGMVGGHRLGARGVGMMDFGMMHGGGGGPMNGSGSGTGVGGGMGGGGGGMRMGGNGGGGSLHSPSSFLPPPGEDTDQQELLRLQQTNYRVKMLPPPLTYEVHRKIWSKNEYGEDDDEAHGGCLEHQEEESLHSLVNEDPIDKEQRLEAYKQIMQRWYSHIHVLEGKSEVAKRLVRVRRACPSMEEVITSLNNPPTPQQQQQQMQSGAATNTTGSDGGDDETALYQPPQQQQQQQQQAPPPPASTRRSPSDPLDTEEVLAAWSARCWDWWQETVKRKPRRARKQGELPLGAGPGGGAVGLPTSASAPMVAGMAESGMPHSLSARAMDMEMSSPHMPVAGSGHGSPYAHYGSPYASHGNGSGMEMAAAAAAAAAGVPMAPSYTSFTDLSEEGGMVEGAGRSLGQSPLQHQQQHPQQSRPSSHAGQQLAGPPPPHTAQARSTPPQQAQLPPQHQQQQQVAAPPASMFTTNGIRAAAPRSGNPDEFLENDHLTLAFTTELLKSLEE